MGYLMMVDGDCSLNMMPANGISIEDQEDLLPLAEYSRRVVPHNTGQEGWGQSWVVLCWPAGHCHGCLGSRATESVLNIAWDTIFSRGHDGKMNTTSHKYWHYESWEDDHITIGKMLTTSHECWQDDHSLTWVGKMVTTLHKCCDDDHNLTWVLWRWWQPHTNVVNRVTTSHNTNVVKMITT